MKLLIGKNLKQFRRGKGLTQEDVALHLGVSYQAVSKWERDEGYPEITMLPSLANYLGVSVDRLIGMEEIANKNRYEEINAAWYKNNQQGKVTGDESYHQKNIILMREAIKIYPNDQLILVQLATSLCKLSGTETEKRNRLTEAVKLQEQILSGEDSEVRSATLYNICFDYETLGEHEKAIAAADKLPNLYKSRENAFALLGSKEEKRAASRSALDSLRWVLHLHLKTLAETEDKPEYIEIWKEIETLLNSVCKGENK